MRSKALLATFGTTGVTMAMSLITSVILARCLGPEGRGAVMVIIFWPTLLLGLFQLSLNEATAYHVARSGGDQDALRRDHQIASALTLQLLLAGGATTVSLLVLPFILGGARAKYLDLAMCYAVAYTPLTFLDLYYNAVRQGRRDIIGLNLLRLCQPFVYAIALVVFVFTSSIRIETVLVAMILAIGVSVTIGVLLEGAKPPRWNLSTMRDLLRTAFRFHGVNVLLYVSAEIDKVLVIHWMDETRVGLYAASLGVSVLGSGLVAQSLILLACAKIASVSERHEQVALVCQFTQIAMLCLILVNGVVALLSSWLVPALYGREFAAAVPVAIILLLMNTFKGLRQVMDRALRATLSTRVSIRSEIVGILCFVIVAPIGSLIGGLTGIAWAMAGAQLIALAVMIVGASRHFNLTMHELLGLRLSIMSQAVGVLTREYRAIQERVLR